MNGLSTVLIVVGLFFLGGAYSFIKQRMPTGVVVLLAGAGVLSLVAGILRLEVW